MEVTDNADRKEAFLKIAKQSSDLMMHLINDILDFSQIESKKMILNFEQVNLRAVFDKCVDILSFKASSKGISVISSIDASMPASI